MTSTPTSPCSAGNQLYRKPAPLFSRVAIPGTAGLNPSARVIQLRPPLFLFFEKNPEGMRTNRLVEGQDVAERWGVVGLGTG